MTEQVENKDIGGRPTKYRKEYTRLAYQMALLGATDEQIAEALNVHVDSIYAWKTKHKGFSESLRRGKIQADAEVATGLFKRAKGFKYDEVTYERIELGEMGEPATDDDEPAPPIKQGAFKKKVVTKYVPPDTGAAMGWLKNRQKELWRDKQDIGIEFENMTDAQLDRVIERMTDLAIKQSHNG